MSTLGERILELITQHPEGLTALEIRVHLKGPYGKNIGGILEGMRRCFKVKTRGSGKDMRYFVACCTGDDILCRNEREDTYHG